MHEEDTPMFAAYHKTIVRRFFAQVLNGRDRAAVGDLFAGHPLLAAATVRTAAAYHRAIPDVRFVLDALIAEDDRVAACWTARGTHVVAARGIVRRAAPVRITGVYVFRLADGAIVGLRPHTRWPEDTDRRDAQN